MFRGFFNVRKYCTGPGYIVRKAAGATDVNKIRDMLLKHFMLQTMSIYDTQSKLHKQLNKLVKPENGAVFVAENNGILMGSVGVELHTNHFDEISSYMDDKDKWMLSDSSLVNRDAYIDLLCTSPFFRGQGVATNLCEHAVHFAKKNKMQRIWAHVLEYNEFSRLALQNAGLEFGGSNEEEEEVYMGKIL